MKPTNRLRFVERIDINTERTYKILQQWWEESMSVNLGWTGEIPIGQAKGEWRDVPLEAE